MHNSQRFWRGLFITFFIAALYGGLAVPLVEGVPARAASVRQAAALDVVINEIGWSGTPASQSAEWIELYNTTGSDINLAGWFLTDNGDINEPLSGTITAGGYFLLERGSDNVITDITADLIYTGGLTNGGETLYLDELGVPIDSANAFGAGNWPAGTGAGGSPPFASMERINPLIADSDSNWATNNGAVINGHDNSSPTPLPIIGTPRAANSMMLALTATVTPTNTGLPTSTFTATATSTATNTATFTATNTATGTATPTLPPAATGMIISEIRFHGSAGGTDEFIELHNSSANPIDTSGWFIRRSTGCGGSVATPIAVIPAGPGSIVPPGKHYLIGGLGYNDVVTPDLPNQDLGIADDGGVALFQADGTLVDQVGLCITTAYHEGTALSPLTTNVDRGYDRQSSGSSSCRDTNNNAADFFLRSPSDPQNRSSAGTLCGNPTPTPTRTRTPFPTPTKIKTRTPTPAPPPPLVAINEFVPRPGHDWNHDGIVNTGDEYIELLNHGVVDVNLSGYSLDDEVNIGSSPFRLPAITLKPGERMVFYGRETGLLLSDGGDAVRLLKPNGQLADAYNYTVARYPDESFCRLPDNGGLDDWNQNCFPTPGLPNSQSGSAPRPPTTGSEGELCPITDTLPEDFAFAECLPFGNGIWNAYYWDRNGWLNQRYLPGSPNKWPLFGD